MFVDSSAMVAMLTEAIGADLMKDVEIAAAGSNASSASKIDTPLWDSLARVSSALVPSAEIVPTIIVMATDARFFRRADSVAYGYGLFSNQISFKDFSVMFHGTDERVDQESLRLTEALWEGVARDFVRLVQSARKDAGLHVSDRIRIELRADDGAFAALDAHEDMIRREVLATAITRTDGTPSGFVSAQKLREADVEFGIERAG